MSRRISDDLGVGIGAAGHKHERPRTCSGTVARETRTRSALGDGLVVLRAHGVSSGTDSRGRGGARSGWPGLRWHIQDADAARPKAHALLSSERTEVTVPLTDGDCLLIKPGLADAALDVPQVSVAELEMASLRTYGWAQT
jgi:hypothetical protein